MNNLIIETTRRCQFNCDHCLRGTQQPVTMAKQHITTLCEYLQDDYISQLTFSGGEPSLPDAVEGIEFTLSELKRHNIALGGFYIATNGYEITESFIMACIKLRNYAGEKDMCEVSISNDYFHSKCGNYDTELLDGLAFFTRKHKEESYIGHDDNWLNEGNYAEHYANGKEVPTTKIVTQENYDEAEIYLNVFGYVINGCDWSYTSQPLHTLCHVDNLAEYYSNLKGENDE
jgi:organic radical activating enzyme